MSARIAVKPHDGRRPGNRCAIPIDNRIPQLDRLNRHPPTARALRVGTFDSCPVDDVGESPSPHSEGNAIVGKNLNLRGVVLNLRGRTVHRQLDHSNILARFIAAIHRDWEKDRNAT